LVGLAVPDVYQTSVVVLGAPVLPQLIQLVLPGIYQQPEPFARYAEAPVVFPETGTARTQGFEVTPLPKPSQPRRPLRHSRCIIRRELRGVGYERQIAS